MTLIAGIDEAGRGPIIGPLVIAGVLIDEKDEQKLKAAGVKDSKLLDKATRERLFDEIKGIAKSFLIIEVPAGEVDDAVFGKGGLNLNSLEARKTALILNSLNPAVAYVDSPSNNLSAYRQLLASQLENPKMKVIAEHKADVNYPVVGAASILAKVRRDREIERIKKEIRIDFGSGYLSDPKTAAFLEMHHEGHGSIFRKSWLPYQQKLSSKFQSTLERYSSSHQNGSQNKEIVQKLKKLEKLGYTEVPVSSTHEQIRMRGACTITLYKNGKLLIQGNEGDKEKIEKLLV